MHLLDPPSWISWFLQKVKNRQTKINLRTSKKLNNKKKNCRKSCMSNMLVAETSFSPYHFKIDLQLLTVKAVKALTEKSIKHIVEVSANVLDFLSSAGLAKCYNDFPFCYNQFFLTFSQRKKLSGFSKIITELAKRNSVPLCNRIITYLCNRIITFVVA